MKLVHFLCSEGGNFKAPFVAHPEAPEDDPPQLAVSGPKKIVFLCALSSSLTQMLQAPIGISLKARDTDSMRMLASAKQAGRTHTHTHTINTGRVP